MGAFDDIKTKQVLGTRVRGGVVPQTWEDKVAAEGGRSGNPVEDFVAGYGSAIPRMVRGIGQRIGAVSQEEADAANKADAPLLRSGPGAAGNILGNVAPGVAAAFAPGGNTVLGQGIIGGMFGAATPTSADESVTKNILNGAAFGAGAQIAGRAAPAAGAALTAPFTQGGRQRIVGNTLRQFSDGPLNVTPAQTPGWQATLAEATQDPGMAILTRGAQARSPDVARALAERQTEQNGAVVNAVRNIAGSPQERQWAEGVREMMSRPLYDEAMREGVDQGVADAMRPAIDSLMRRPAIMEARARAARIFGEQDMAQVDAGSVAGLQMLKQGLDDAIGAARNPGSAIGRRELEAMQQTRADLINVLAEVAPNLRRADVNYATFSRPLNEQAVGQELERRLTPALMDGQDIPGRVRADAFANALRNLDDQIPRITGYPGATVENVMSPGAMRTLEGARSDMARRAVSQEMGRGPGSNTGQNLAIGNVLEQSLGPTGLPTSWAQSILARTAASPLGLVYNRGAEQRVQEELARALLDPAYAQQLLSRGPTAINPRLLDAYRGALGGAAPGMLSYGMTQ